MVTLNRLHWKWPLTEFTILKRSQTKKKRFWLQRWSLAHSQMPYRKSNKQSIQYYFKTVYFQIHIYLQFNPNLGNRGLFWYWDASGVPSLRLWNRPPWLHGDILWAMKLKWSPWAWLRISRLPHLGRLIGVLILVLTLALFYRLYREPNHLKII